MERNEKQGCPKSTYLLNTVLKDLARTIIQLKGIKQIHIRKEESKVSLFADMKA